MAKKVWPQDFVIQLLTHVYLSIKILRYLIMLTTSLNFKEPH